MKNFKQIFETYFMVLVHPYKIHEQFRHNVAIPGHGGHIYKPLSLAESISVSWIFAIIRGLGKIVLINFFLHTFLNAQSEEFPFLKELMKDQSISMYYFVLFSAALDIIFFPVTTIIMTEVWAWMIKKYAKVLNPRLPAEDIADEITTHALSSNLLSVVPIIGDGIQSLMYYFLLFTGLRANLGASRSLAFVILITPTILFMMMISLIFFLFFYLMA